MLTIFRIIRAKAKTSGPLPCYNTDVPHGHMWSIRVHRLGFGTPETRIGP